MPLLDSIILGIVEGLTEFLPISSTGHLILASRVLGLAESDFLKTFEIAIQLGAILAVIALYWRTLTTNLDVWKKILAAFLPTAVLGFVFYGAVKNLLGSEAVVLWSLFLGGVFLIGFELWYAKKQSGKLVLAGTRRMPPAGHARSLSPSLSPSENHARSGSESPAQTTSPTASKISALSFPVAFFIGLFQAVAMIPGVSRSGATIVGGLLLGMERKAIVEFSFLLAVPTMLAATGYDLYKNAGAFSLTDFSALGAGFIVSFFAALLAVKTFLRFIESHSFISFGIYRIFAAILFFFLFF